MLFRAASARQNNKNSLCLIWTWYEIFCAYKKLVLIKKKGMYTFSGGYSFKMACLLSEKDFTLKGKNLLPVGANSFFFFFFFFF